MSNFECRKCGEYCSNFLPLRKEEIKNDRDKNLYMQGYEQGLTDANLGKFYNEGYMYGIEVENKNFIRNLEEYLWELEERRKKRRNCYWILAS